MKTRRMCKDFLRMKKGMTFDAVAAMQSMIEDWGVRVDWHEFSYALEEMERHGEAERVNVPGYDRMTCYLIA